MSDAFDYILINDSQVSRPPKFAPQKVDVYKGDYTTCTGKLIADRIGWKYEEMTLEWPALPQSMVDVLVAMDAGGVSTIVFDTLGGFIVQEDIVRVSAVGLRHCYTLRGTTYWKDVKVKIRFINTHTGTEEPSGVEEVTDDSN